MTSARCIWLDFGWWPHRTETGMIRRLLSWNAESGELAFGPVSREPPMVLAVLKDEDEVRARLDGWEIHNTDPDGIAWLARRLEGCR